MSKKEGAQSREGGQHSRYGAAWSPSRPLTAPDDVWMSGECFFLLFSFVVQRKHRNTIFCDPIVGNSQREAYCVVDAFMRMCVHFDFASVSLAGTVGRLHRESNK